MAATAQDILRLRRLTNYTDVDPYDDTDLGAMIDTKGMNASAFDLWSEKAAELAAMVNTSESGSSRSLGDAYKNALAMAKHFKDLVDAETPIVEVSNFARTRAIVRESA